MIRWVILTGNTHSNRRYHTNVCQNFPSSPRDWDLETARAWDFAKCGRCEKLDKEHSPEGYEAARMTLRCAGFENASIVRIRTEPTDVYALRYGRLQGDKREEFANWCEQSESVSFTDDERFVSELTLPTVKL